MTPMPDAPGPLWLALDWLADLFDTAAPEAPHCPAEWLARCTLGGGL